MKYAIPPLAFALSVLCAPSIAQQEQIVERLTQCGGIGLVMQRVSRQAGDEGNVTAQIRYQSGFGLMEQSMRLIGEVTECAPTFDAVYGAMSASAERMFDAIQQDVANETTNPTEVHQRLLEMWAGCTADVGFEVMISAQVRIASEGLGCAWQPI